MLRFILGVIVGGLLAAAVALAAVGSPVAPLKPELLYSWTGQGMRPGLYYDANRLDPVAGGFAFYECRKIGESAPAVPPR